MSAIPPTPAELIDPARRSRVWRRTIRRLVAVVLVLLLALAAVVVLWWSAKTSDDANKRSLKTSQQALATSQAELKLAQCIDNALALRNTPSGADSDAYRAIFSAINDVVIAPMGPAQQAAFVNFQKVLATEQAVLNQDASFRADHPLGQC